MRSLREEEWCATGCAIETEEGKRVRSSGGHQNRAQPLMNVLRQKARDANWGRREIE